MKVFHVHVVTLRFYMQIYNISPKFPFLFGSHYNLDCVRSGNFWGRGPESYTISIDYVNSQIQRYFLRISLKVAESIFSPVGLGA